MPLNLEGQGLWLLPPALQIPVSQTFLSSSQVSPYYHPTQPWGECELKESIFSK